MWYILILPCWCFRVDLCLEEEYEMILRIKIIRFPFIITCASCLHRLIASGYKLGWAMVFELVLSVVIVMVEPVVYPLGHSMSIFLGLTLGKNIWLEFHLSLWLYLWLALEKGLLLDYHWCFCLLIHLDLQIMELICLAHFWERLFGCDFYLNQSGVCFPAAVSRLSAKLLAGRWVFLASLPLELFSHLIWTQ